MNVMTKAHQIRKKAAAKFNCAVSEIHFGECLRLAHNNEDLGAACTKEIWNQAAAGHVMGQAGLTSLVRSVAEDIGTTDFQVVADHLYGRFIKAKKNDKKGYYHFGLYLNQMFDNYCK